MAFSKNDKPGFKGERKAHYLAFALLCVAWLALDVGTKAFFENSQELGQVVSDIDVLGLIQFRLVHNTGMAWSMFSDSTLALGVLSLVVCAIVAFGYFKFVPKPNWPFTVGAALVVSGGLGNALDRLFRGYVVDFFETTFIDFPVFNVADIGVTCGFVLIFVGLWLSDGILRDDSDAQSPSKGE